MNMKRRNHDSDCSSLTDGDGADIEERGFSKNRFIFALRKLNIVPKIVSDNDAREIYDSIECLGGGQDSGEGKNQGEDGALYAPNSFVKA